ncbi:MAG TPA: acyl-CoA thioesterase domain-containing protein [Burkholderiales bacterium]|nr:acyl-CoA thioesterase domain-containing protein [Burkholderiales bacterium]
MNSKSRDKSDASAIRNQVLLGLAGNRSPGFHFPGHFLQLAWPRIGEDSVDEAMPAGPHCRDADGNIHLAALGVMLDTALATAPRLKIAPGARQATVQLNVQFTGHPARDDLVMTAKLLGFSAGTAVRHSLAGGTLFSSGRPVCHANGSFVVLPPPAGVTLAPLPWQRTDGLRNEPLTDAELDAGERAVIRACDAALAKADGKHPFIEHFWNALPEHTHHGARCAVKNGPHIGNRVGHVQGGILLGLAAATAVAAVPRHPMLSGISSWFISPGKGKALRVRSKVLHAGRSFAVVRTEIKTADGTRVLETVSNHAANS